MRAREAQKEEGDRKESGEGMDGVGGRGREVGDPEKRGMGTQETNPQREEQRPDTKAETQRKKEIEPEREEKDKGRISK